MTIVAIFGTLCVTIVAKLELSTGGPVCIVKSQATGESLRSVGVLCVDGGVSSADVAIAVRYVRDRCDVSDNKIQGTAAANGNGDLVVGVGGPAFRDSNEPPCK